MGNGVAVLIQHVGAAVFTDVDGAYNIIEEGLAGHEVYHADDIAVHNAVFPQGSGNDDGQFTGYLAHNRSGNVAVALHTLGIVVTVGIVVSIQQADTVGIQDVGTCHVVFLSPLVHQGLFFFSGHGVSGDVAPGTEGYSYIPIGFQLFFDTAGCDGSCGLHGIFQLADRTGVAHIDAHSADNQQKYCNGTDNTRHDFCAYAFQRSRSQLYCVKIKFLHNYFITFIDKVQ